MRGGHVLLIFTMVLAACGGEVEAPVPAAETVAAPAATEVVVDDRFTIVMLGDSLTAGFGLATKYALPEQMADIFKRNGFDIKVINAGVSGDTTAAGLARYDWSVGSADADLLVVALGANDFLNGSSPVTARRNLAEIIERAKSDGLQVILAGVEAGAIAGRDVEIGEYAAIYPELAAAYDVPLFDDILGGVRGNPDLLQLDGLHPTRRGARVMAERMAKFVGAYLPE